MFCKLPDFVSESESSNGDENTDPQNTSERNTRRIYTKRHAFSLKLEARTSSTWAESAKLLKLSCPNV